MSVNDYSIIILYSYIPALILGAYFWWMDRFERESLFLVFLVFLWGAFGSTSLSAFGNQFLSGVSGFDEADGLLSTILIAPFVEELCKGILIVLLLRLKKIDNVTDGILLGIVIGLGFAAQENVFYAEQIYNSSGELAMWNNLWVREVRTTLLHGSTTAVWGAMIGYARIHQGFLRKFTIGNGFILAMVTHAFWNLLVSYKYKIEAEFDIIEAFMRLELILIFGMLLTLYLVSIKRQSRLIVRELSEESLSGLIPEEHIAYFASMVRHPKKFNLPKKINPQAYAKLGVKLAFRKYEYRFCPSPATLKEILRLKKAIKEVVGDHHPSATLPKLKTQRLEFLFMATLGFAIFIILSIMSYRFFIMGRLKDSIEFKTASFFAVNSHSLSEILLTPIQSLEFDEIHVTEKENQGFSEITFQMDLKDGLHETLRVSLVKVADFWIVYQAELNPDSPRAQILPSTYGKIILLMERLDFGDFEAAQNYLRPLKREILDSILRDFLEARVNALAGHVVPASQLLKDLESRVKHSHLAVLYTKALLEFNQDHFLEAIAILTQMEELYESYQKDENLALQGWAPGLPKNPFLASLEPDSVIASSRKLLALSYHNTGNYLKGLDWSEAAIKQAQKIGSTVIYSSSIYLKALNLYDLQRFDEADREFTHVIHDLDNPNLKQKAWAYFFRGDVASRYGRHEESLDFYEIAVALEPKNGLIRQGVISYLMNRGYGGDLEIALGMALRGIDFGVEKEVFKDLASQIYYRLGVKDKTRSLK